MSEMVTLVLDCNSDDDYAYRKEGESDSEYKTRMEAWHERLMEQATNEEKQLAADVLNSLVTAQIT